MAETEQIIRERRESVTLENDNQKILGVLHLPSNITEKIPAILFCHGLAGNKVGKQRLFVSLAKRLAEKGIAVLRLDFRGAGDSEGEIEDMTVETQVSDAIEGLKWLSMQDYIDTDRIGIFGRSFGGTIAVIAAQKFKNIKSIGLWAPLFNGDQWKDNWRALLADRLSTEEKYSVMTFDGQTCGIELFEQLFSISMNEYLEKLKNVPLLHIHGEKDKIISPAHADEYKKEREKYQKNNRSKFIRLPQTDHDFSYMPEQAVAIEETVEWFKKTLGGQNEQSE